MTTTEYAYCPHCRDRVELVMTAAGVFACSRCDAIDTYTSKEAYMDVWGDHE